MLVLSISLVWLHNVALINSFCFTFLKALKTASFQNSEELKMLKDPSGSNHVNTSQEDLSQKLSIMQQRCQHLEKDADRHGQSQHV